MKYKHVLVTGGAGFVGSTICLKLKEHFLDINVVAFDNLIRKGSKLNVRRLTQGGVHFVKGDVRFGKDLDSIKNTDLLIECSAEPSVMAGVGSSPKYLIDTNLGGAVECFEFARTRGADVVFLSTSRIYPFDRINTLPFDETETRFEIPKNPQISGVSKQGISEQFPLDGIRSMYGATKLSAEYLLQEYVQTYGMKAIINRFGVIAGPWQMGKVDQGFLTYWLAAHIYKKPLSYFGFGGKGKQVRDIIHVDDVYDVIMRQIASISAFSGQVLNCGGGYERSVSLRELTVLCQNLTGTTIEVSEKGGDRANDVKYFIMNAAKLEDKLHWKPKKTLPDILTDTYNWIIDNRSDLEPILSA